MRDDKVSRRRALQVLGAVPLLGVAAQGVLSGCGKKGAPDSCNDVSGLSEAELSARTALQYVDKSPKPEECDACALYQPAPEASACGGCQIVKGPIHPKGYCTAFAPKPAA